MIRSITSTLNTFKELHFTSGLNVLLADVYSSDADTSRDKRTRNSAGKTSLIELLHFMLGSANDASPCFKDPKLVAESFSMRYTARDGEIGVSRSGKTPNEIRLIAGSDVFRLDLIGESASGQVILTQKQYASALGHLFFDFPSPKTETYSPTFRAIAAYLIRRDYDGGFQEAEKNSSKQPPWNSQVNLSFVLGLDWHIAREFQLVRDRTKALKVLKAANKDGTLDSIVDSVASLRVKLARAESKASTTRERVRNFVVADAYNELAEEAATLLADIKKLTATKLADQERERQLLELLERERVPSEGDVTELFTELNTSIPDIVLKRFRDVRAFHESVIKNRREGLSSEIAAVRGRIKEKSDKIKVADARRSEILNYLSGKGAFEDLLSMQRELSRQEATIAELQRQFDSAQLLEGEKAALDVERRQLLRRLQDDMRARNETLNRAAVIVDELVSEFYDDRNGQLLVRATPNGPDFKIEIDGDRGGGISKVEIFCFDIMLMKMLRSRNLGPAVLVHDSHLFDGVDQRQVAKAIEIGLRTSTEAGFQYIVTMNSDVWDALPFADRKAVEDCVLSTRLDDRRGDGGLFGVALAERRPSLLEAEEDSDQS